MALGPILRIRRGHPPPHRHRTAIVETHNMKTQKFRYAQRRPPRYRSAWVETYPYGYSAATGRFEVEFRSVIFKLDVMTDGIQCNIG